MQLAERAAQLIAVLQGHDEQVLASRASEKHLGQEDRLEEHLWLIGLKSLLPCLGLAQKRVGPDDGSSEGATMMRMVHGYRQELGL
jgi:hypothetical protein